MKFNFKIFKFIPLNSSKNDVYEDIVIDLSDTPFEQDAQTAYVSENEAAQEAEQIEHTELELAGVPEVEAVSPDTPDEPAADPVVVDIPLLNESLAFSEVKDENEADANDDETLA